MDRRLMDAVNSLRGLAFGASLAVLALGGCSNDGYEGKEFSQEFEKPKDYPTESIKEPDVYPGDGEEPSPRERRSALKGEG